MSYFLISPIVQTEKIRPIRTYRTIRIIIKSSITVQLARVRTIEDTNGINRNSGAFHLLRRINRSVCNRSVKIRFRCRHTAGKDDTAFLTVCVVAGIGIITRQFFASSIPSPTFVAPEGSSGNC